MKTESEVAQENLKSYKKFNITFKALTQHKESCKRFLEFLVKTFGEGGFDKKEEFDMIIKNKIKDLQQAIKLYKEAGI